MSLDVTGPPDLRVIRGDAGQHDEDLVPESPAATGPETLQVWTSSQAVREIRQALIDRRLPRVFVTDGQLVHLAKVSGTLAEAAADEDQPLPVRAADLTPPLLAGLIAHHMRLERSTKDGGFTEWLPPSAVLSAALSGTQWPGLDPLVGMVGMPVIRRDGTLLQDPGYDRSTGLWMAPTVRIPRIPEHPEPRQVRAARAFLLGRLLSDFPWAAPADRANYLGLLFAPFLRRFLRGQVPLGIVTATMPGSGKTILTALIGLLTGQRILPWADDEPELRKAITSVFTAEAGVVVFDNLAEGTSIDSPVLANLLTTPTWTDRLLGSTRVGTWANDRLWMVTGNNLRVGGDIASRSTLVRLEPDAPHPEQRTGQRIPHLDTWVMDPANRGTVLSAVLVLILDWIGAGAPRAADVAGMRQFSTWASGVGGLLAHHGVEGFMGNLDALRASDEEDLRWEEFLHMWHHRHGTRWVRARELLADAEVTVCAGEELDPWDGQFITSPRGGRPKSAQMLGRWLEAHVGRFHGSYRVAKDYDTHRKTASYRVEIHDPDA